VGNDLPGVVAASHVLMEKQNVPQNREVRAKVSE
jgi:hypothetical protein